MQRPIRPNATFRLLLVGLLTGALGLLFVQLTSTTPVTTGGRSSEKVNLALRRTAHHLLRAAGDSTSTIAAVEQSNAQTYRLRLDHAFDYDRLPGLLQASFRVHQITDPYDVAVLNCATGALQLGYSVTDLTDNQTVPCRGRLAQAGCYVLRVTFATPPAATPQRTNAWPLLALVGALVGLLVIGWRQQTRLPPAAPLAGKTTDNPNRLQFGQSYLDVMGQTLISGTHQHSLTYRETKLLRMLVGHANEVLDRDHILKQVWEDEGITVSHRSVDVFISRLRKLLQDDPTVKITAVHGVGYRLEVS
ncbi:winged helix-turn-helix domain-containing protein [Fibrella aquatilis]|uniref:Winged helix-turn-helix transcriptional regulator n=1 Tax=Fibrella aquatilis TaxID=2817059 RepID=A0A939G589_9BACT|nr:winged helix-turn-helix domain-containing protein [Fibrella aquatilis]MBO0930869.1 winged helix-turn-helix transcriptional regulator [Fibrella aquatilis]